MIDILLNGKKTLLKDKLYLDKLLKKFGYHPLTIATAVNQNFVPRSLYKETLVRTGDVVEIVTIMQGG
jgi:sulfur carrier protein